MATIIYLHGFGSVGKGAKPDALRAAFPNDTVLSPDLPFAPDEVIAVLNNLVDNATSYPLFFVGTSLGGFWANYAAHRFDAPCVLVNPAVSPSTSMKLRMGGPCVNYYTKEPIVITGAHLAHFAALEKKTDERYNGALVNLFLAKDDETLDAAETAAAFPFTRSTAVYEDGGHRFEAHWADVVAKVAEVMPVAGFG